MPKNIDKKCDHVCVGDISKNITNVMIKTPPITFSAAKNAGNAENTDKFICEMCDFKCSKYSNYITHLATRKHQTITTKITMNQPNNAETNQVPIHVLVVPNTCPNCNKHYLHRSGLSRHRKTCITSSSTHTNNASQSITRDEYNNIIQLLHELKNKDKSKAETNEEYSDDNDIYPKQNIKISSNDRSQMMIDTNIQNKLMLELIKSNTQLQTQMYEICKSSHALTTNNISAHTIHDNSTTNNTNNNTTNNINNTFSMNMFLNEKCKDAMNMKDFVNSIHLNMTDLENVGRLGYVEGMSNIFIDNLQKTDVYKRPVHCSDVKRETLYVKENNEWQRDGPEHEKMTNAILAVEQKNVVLVNEWAKANPRCMNSNTRENEKYFKLSKIVTDGEKDGNIDKVIRKVAKKVTIEKDPTPQIE